MDKKKQSGRSKEAGEGREGSGSVQPGRKLLMEPISGGETTSGMKGETPWWLVTKEERKNVC